MEGDTEGDRQRERSTRSNPVQKAGQSERLGPADLGTGEMRGPGQGQGMWPGPQVEEGRFEEGRVYGKGAESQGRRRAPGGASFSVITGQHLQVTGSPHLGSLMFFYPLLNWIWSRENLGDISISSGTRCINPRVPACWCAAECANRGTASPSSPCAATQTLLLR